MRFQDVADRVARLAGSRWAFIGASSTIVVWLVTGPIFHFSDTWQLVINTGTTIVTYLMVFLIQNSQNRGDAALHAKLDEIIRVLPTRNELIGLQLKSEEEIASAGEEIQAKAEENTNPS